jgi:signal transduction histidine kinase
MVRAPLRPQLLQLQDQMDRLFRTVHWKAIAFVVGSAMMCSSVWAQDGGTPLSGDGRDGRPVVLLGVLLLVAFGVILFRLSRRLNVALRDLLQQKEMIESQKAEIEQRNVELSAKNRELEQLNLEKDGLMGIVAHDLKAPLVRSSGLLQMLRELGDLNPKQEKVVGMIETVNRDAEELVRTLLDLKALENLTEPPLQGRFDLVALLAASVEGFRDSATKKSITLHFDPPAQEIEVLSNSSYLGRIVDNLVSNAIKFSPIGRNVFVGVSREADTVAIMVRDEGPGISPEEQEKMFNKFQRLSARPTGGESSTGLGLAITKALVEKLNARITLQSELGAGAEFKVELSESNKK